MESLPTCSDGAGAGGQAAARTYPAWVDGTAHNALTIASKIRLVPCVSREMVTKKKTEKANLGVGSLASLVLRPVAVLALPGGPHPTESAMSYFGGMDQEKDQKLAWKGKATDPKVQAMRDKLEKERLAEDAEAEKRLKAENKAYMAMIAAEGAAEDDDIMDEEAGRQRLVMAKKSKEFYKEEKSALQHANLDNRRRLKNVKSKIHSYNVCAHARTDHPARSPLDVRTLTSRVPRTLPLAMTQDQWNAKIDKRHQEEAQIEALLMEIRDRVQGGTVDDDREGMHALEKQLAKAQVGPPRPHPCACRRLPTQLRALSLSLERERESHHPGSPKCPSPSHRPTHSGLRRPPRPPTNLPRTVHSTGWSRRPRLMRRCSNTTRRPPPSSSRCSRPCTSQRSIGTPSTTPRPRRARRTAGSRRTSSTCSLAHPIRSPTPSDGLWCSSEGCPLAQSAVAAAPASPLAPAARAASAMRHAPSCE